MQGSAFVPPNPYLVVTSHFHLQLLLALHSTDERLANGTLLIRWILHAEQNHSKLRMHCRLDCRDLLDLLGCLCDPLLVGLEALPLGLTGRGVWVIRIECLTLPRRSSWAKVEKPPAVCFFCRNGPPKGPCHPRNHHDEIQGESTFMCCIIFRIGVFLDSLLIFLVANQRACPLHCWGSAAWASAFFLLCRCGEVTQALRAGHASCSGREITGAVPKAAGKVLVM